MAEGDSPRVEELEETLKKQRGALEELREALKEERASLLEQATNFYFEIAKHLTTLNTAAILVYLAAAGSGEISLPLWVALLFVGSLAGATLSMLVTGLRGISFNRFVLGNFGMAVAVVFFFGGLLYSVLHALLLP